MQIKASLSARKAKPLRRQMEESIGKFKNVTKSGEFLRNLVLHLGGKALGYRLPENHAEEIAQHKGRSMRLRTGSMK